MQPAGKRFESDLIKSISEERDYIRLKDAWWWSNWTNTRFTSNNPCDFLIFTGDFLYYMELKSTLGSSLPVGNIKKHQMDSLTTHDTKRNVYSYLVINFRDHEKTFLLAPWYANDILSVRKSIPIQYCMEKGILIPQHKKIKRYTYDLSLLDNINARVCKDSIWE